MRLRVVVAALIVVAAAAVTMILTVMSRPVADVDPVMLNDLRYRVQTSWDRLDPADFADVRGPFAVVDAGGRIRIATPGAPTDELAAAGEHAAVLPVVVGGSRVGTVFHVDRRQAGTHDWRGRQTAWVATGAVLLTTAVALLVIAWVQVRFLRPFRRMRSFATRVAGGELDIPLEMDRANAFGAFTESFDLMRSELAASHAREDALRQSKQALVAQLSHDIRTPVASISAVAELLQLGEPDPSRAARLGTIVGKSAQIDDLVAELFRANRDEIETLPVTLDEHSAAELGALVEAADLMGRVTGEPPPSCLVRYDVRRIRQVLDNILNNSEKYAGTPVVASWRLDQHVLRLTLADIGAGVPEGELETLLGRGVRGSNAGSAPGLGLGLYTSAWLMERMGGSLAVRNTHPGFAVDLDVALAGSAGDQGRANK